MRIGKRRCSAASGHTGVSARSARAVSADGGMREHARNWRDRCVTQRAGPAPRAAVRACPRGGPTHLLNSEHIDIRAVREPAAGAIGARQWQCSAWRQERACGVRCRRGAWRVCVVPVQAVRGAGGAGAARPGRQSLGDRRAARVALRSIGAPAAALRSRSRVQSRTRLPHCPLHILVDARVRFSFISWQFFASLPCGFWFQPELSPNFWIKFLYLSWSRAETSFLYEW